MGSTRRNIRGLFRELMELTDGKEDLQTGHVEIHFIVDESRKLTVPHFLGYGDLVDLTIELAARWGVAQNVVQMQCNRIGERNERELNHDEYSKQN